MLLSSTSHRLEHVHRTPPASLRWIVGQRFDLVWFVGGALSGYAMFFLHAGLSLDMLTVWFVWFVCLDSPHFFGTYSRTYLDREQWRERRGLLLGSLALFLVPPLVLLASFAMHRIGLPHATAGLVALAAVVNLWAYWHVVRQHYGIMALYQRKNDDTDPSDRRIDSLLLYTGLLAPFAAFLVRHPETRAVLGLAPMRDAGAWEASFVRAVVATSATAVVVVALVFASRQLQRWRLGLAVNVPKTLFLSAVVPLHLSIGYSEAVLTAPILGFAAFVTIFHDVQYHAIVWFYQRNRYRNDDAARFGPAAWVGRSFVTFMACALTSGAIMGFASCSLGVQPGCTPLLDTSAMTLFGDVTFRDLFFGVFLGFLMHHYFLDQFIWRPSRDERLRLDLDLAVT